MAKAGSFEQYIFDLNRQGIRLEDHADEIFAGAKDKNTQAWIKHFRKQFSNDPIATADWVIIGEREGWVQKTPGPMCRVDLGVVAFDVPEDSSIARIAKSTPARLNRAFWTALRDAGVEIRTMGAMGKMPEQDLTLGEKIFAFPGRLIGTVLGFKWLPGAEAAWEAGTFFAKYLPRSPIRSLLGMVERALPPGRVRAAARAGLPATVPGAAFGGGEAVLAPIYGEARAPLPIEVVSGAGMGAVGAGLLAGGLGAIFPGKISPASRAAWARERAADDARMGVPARPVRPAPEPAPARAVPKPRPAVPKPKPKPKPKPVPPAPVVVRERVAPVPAPELVPTLHIVVPVGEPEVAARWEAATPEARRAFLRRANAPEELAEVLWPQVPEPVKQQYRLAEFGASNTVFTREAMEAAQARMRTRPEQFRAGGPTPEELRDWVVVGGYHAEALARAGVKGYNAWAERMVGTWGEDIKPHLPVIYRQVSKQAPGLLEAPTEAQRGLARAPEWDTIPGEETIRRAADELRGRGQEPTAASVIAELSQEYGAEVPTRGQVEAVMAERPPAAPERPIDVSSVVASKPEEWQAGYRSLSPSDRALVDEQLAKEVAETPELKAARQKWLRASDKADALEQSDTATDEAIDAARREEVSAGEEVQRLERAFRPPAAAPERPPAIPAAAPEAYRWSNAAELVELGMGVRPRTSLDATLDPNMYFPPPTAKPATVGKRGMGQVYTRVVLDRPALENLGYAEDAFGGPEVLFRSKAERTPEFVKAYLAAIKRVEVDESSIPEGLTFESVADAIQYRLGRPVEVVLSDVSRPMRPPSVPPAVAKPPAPKPAVGRVPELAAETAGARAWWNDLSRQDRAGLAKRLRVPNRMWRADDAPKTFAGAVEQWRDLQGAARAPEPEGPMPSTPGPAAEVGPEATEYRSGGTPESPAFDRMTKPRPIVRQPPRGKEAGFVSVGPGEVMEKVGEAADVVRDLLAKVSSGDTYLKRHGGKPGAARRKLETPIPRENLTDFERSEIEKLHRAGKDSPGAIAELLLRTSNRVARQRAAPELADLREAVKAELDSLPEPQRFARALEILLSQDTGTPEGMGFEVYRIWKAISDTVASDATALGVKVRNSRTGRRVPFAQARREHYFPHSFAGQSLNIEPLVDKLASGYAKREGIPLERARRIVERYVLASGSPRFGQLEMTRLDLPGWNSDPNAEIPGTGETVASAIAKLKAGEELPDDVMRGVRAWYNSWKNDMAFHVEGAYARIEHVRRFGPDNEFADAVIADVRASSPDDAGHVRLVIDLMGGGPNQAIRQTPSWVRAAMNLQVIGRMQFSPIANVTQPFVNVGPIVGPRRLAKAYLGLAGKANREEVLRSGAIYGTIFSDLMRWGAGAGERGALSEAARMFLKRTGFTGVEMWANRGTSFLAFREMAADYSAGLLREVQAGRPHSKQAEFFRRWLRWMGVNDAAVTRRGGITQEQLAIAGVTGSDRTQFMYSALDLPPAIRTHWAARAAFQFKAYVWQQTKFFKDTILAESAKGNHWPLLYTLVGGGIMSELAADTRRGIQGLMSGSWEAITHGDIERIGMGVMEALEERPGTDTIRRIAAGEPVSKKDIAALAQRAAQNLALVDAFGYVGNLVTALVDPWGEELRVSGTRALQTTWAMELTGPSFEMLTGFAAGVWGLGVVGLGELGVIEEPTPGYERGVMRSLSPLVQISGAVTGGAPGVAVGIAAREVMRGRGDPQREARAKMITLLDRAFRETDRNKQQGLVRQARVALTEGGYKDPDGVLRDYWQGLQEEYEGGPAYPLPAPLRISPSRTRPAVGR